MIGRYRRGSIGAGGAELKAYYEKAVSEIVRHVARDQTIPEDVGFRQWAEGLTVARLDPRTGQMIPPLTVDGVPFTLSDRPAMAWIYDQIPRTKEEALRKVVVLRKCAQVGFTVMEMLVVIYMILKFGPMQVGMFGPDERFSRKKSRRFMSIVRNVPEVHTLMAGSEGSDDLRTFGESGVHVLWTSGKTTTESTPMGFVTFDEVQEMNIGDMEKVRERMSARLPRFTLMGSTANWPDADIDHWFQQGTQHRFHTRCPTCGVEEPLDAYFPECIWFDPNLINPLTNAPGEHRYVCRDGHWIDDPQQGTWKPDNPAAEDSRIISIHFHQMLSPTVSARDMYEAYLNADDMKNFYNRKLGKPYQDPSQIPVTLAHLNACAEAGKAAGVVWKARARDTFMGIDQMGGYNVVVIKDRLADGRQAIIHLEEIYDNDPFERCSQLMADYGVRVCVVENLPNWNDAARFAKRHEGKVFICSYGDLGGEAVRWGDAPRLDASDRRTDETERTRYTVQVDQYKAMSRSLGRFVRTLCLFADPQALTQEVKTKGGMKRVPILKDRFFDHMQKTALVTERVKDDERRLRSRVKKVRIDPHFSYANMLCDVAYSRAYGTAMFILPDPDRPSSSPPQAYVPSISAVSELMAGIRSRPTGEICGACEHFPMGPDGPPHTARCPVVGMDTDAKEYRCDYFVAAPGCSSDE